MPDILKDLEPFLQSQIIRLQSLLAPEHIGIQIAPARSAQHAVGERKPSLSQQEMEEEMWTPERPKL
jgi:hypothetical protein